MALLLWPNHLPEVPVYIHPQLIYPCLARYPYRDVTPLALLLWRYHLPEVRTLVRIIYTSTQVRTNIILNLTVEFTKFVFLVVSQNAHIIILYYYISIFFFLSM